MTCMSASGMLSSQTDASRVGRERTEQWTLAEERAELEREHGLAEMEHSLKMIHSLFLVISSSADFDVQQSDSFNLSSQNHFH